MLRKGLLPTNVTLYDEDAANSGGPTREYFTEIFDLFIGKLVYGTRNYSFVHDLVRLEKDEYNYFRYIKALALHWYIWMPRSTLVFQTFNAVIITGLITAEMKKQLICWQREISENPEITLWKP